MHLLAATAGAIEDGKEPVDLGQTPADVVVISAADTELAALSGAREAMEDAPSLRLASMMHLIHPLSVDLHLDHCASTSRLVIVRCLGGVGYWTYGVEQYAARLRALGVPLALLPGMTNRTGNCARYQPCRQMITTRCGRIWSRAVRRIARIF